MPVRVGDYRQAREQGSELMQDLLLYRKDGATFWIESDLIPVRNAAGQLTRWISIGNDITKRRQTEDALRAAKETAETNSRLKSEFLANLSHEIRTPMNAIMGMTELALATPLSDEQREYLQTVRSSSELLLGLLNDILDLSKIEAGKMEMEEIDFSLAEVVSETVKTLEVESPAEGPRAGVARAGRPAGDRARRSDQAAPDPAEPDRQRHQVHRTGPGHGDGGRAVAQRRGDQPAFRGARHRHRNPRRATGRGVRSLQARGRLHDAQVRRLRPRPDHLVGTRPDDERADLGRQHRGAGQHVSFHDPPEVERGAGCAAGAAPPRNAARLAAARPKR